MRREHVDYFCSLSSLPLPLTSIAQLNLKPIDCPVRAYVEWRETFNTAAGERRKKNKREYWNQTGCWKQLKMVSHKHNYSISLSWNFHKKTLTKQSSLGKEKKWEGKEKQRFYVFFSPLKHWNHCGKWNPCWFHVQFCPPQHPTTLSHFYIIYIILISILHKLTQGLIGSVVLSPVNWNCCSAADHICTRAMTFHWSNTYKSQKQNF